MNKRIRKLIKLFDVFFSFCCVVIFTFVIIGELAMPSKLITYNAENHKLSPIYSYGEYDKAQPVDAKTSVTSNETVRLLGIVPVKTVNVVTKKPQKVFVSGETFGIKLYTDGVIVVGTQSIDIDGKKTNPAEDSGIKLGDIIISINNVNVYTSDDVIEILNDNNGKPYKIKVKRDDRYKTFTLEPVYSNREGKYKAGMWVRDSTAGIGTITFYNPNNNSFAALGHQVNDIDTKEIMPMLNGEAVQASVTSVQRGTSGTTGSLICSFSTSSIGRLYSNTSCGVYGTYNKINQNLKSYYVASPQEIEKGKAKIISTIDDEKPKEYEIEITRINYNSDGEKDIVFKVTDSELIKKTGGIVQGMSGSPIIQNDKLVGAVTHVIINNPKKGYGIFAQTMLEESNAVT